MGRTRTIVAASCQTGLVLLATGNCGSPPLRYLRRGRGRGNVLLSEAGAEMLVLSRKVGERIFVGDQVTITVVRITGGGVRIGIEAPPDLTVVREELMDGKRRPAQCSTRAQDKPASKAQPAS